MSEKVKTRPLISNAFCTFSVTGMGAAARVNAKTMICDTDSAKKCAARSGSLGPSAVVRLINLNVSSAAIAAVATSTANEWNGPVFSH